MGDDEEPVWCLNFSSFPLTLKLLNLDVGNESPLLLLPLPVSPVSAYLYQGVREVAERVPLFQVQSFGSAVL